MKSTIQQLAFPNTETPLDKMIPIFIGTSKILHSENLVFTDNTYTTIQLSSNNDYLIDETSINPIIAYWKEAASFQINYTANNNLIELAISINTKFDPNCIFVLEDSLGNLLHTSKITTFTYALNTLTSIKIESPYSESNTFNCKLIYKTKESIPFTYIPSKNIIQLSYENKSTTKIIIDTNNTIAPLGISLSESKLTYNYTNKKITTTTYASITTEDILNEQNLEMSKGLSLSSSAIIISIPNESFIYEAIETIKLLNYGYYIVPISLSLNSINLLKSFIESASSNYSYFTLFIPAETLSISNILSSATYHA